MKKSSKSSLKSSHKSGLLYPHQIQEYWLTRMDKLVDPKLILIHRLVFDNAKRDIDAIVTLGVNLNMQDKTGKTPLHVASIMDHGEIASTLMYAGADVTIKDNDGNSAYDVAYTDDMKDRISRYGGNK